MPCTDFMCLLPAYANNINKTEEFPNKRMAKIMTASAQKKARVLEHMTPCAENISFLCSDIPDWCLVASHCQRCALCTPAEHASHYPRLGYDIIYGPCDNILRS